MRGEGVRGITLKAGGSYLGFSYYDMDLDEQPRVGP